MPRAKSLSVIRAQIRSLEKRAKRIESKADKRITVLMKLISRHSLSLADWKQAVSLSKGGKRGAGKPVPVKYTDDKGNTWLTNRATKQNRRRRGAGRSPARRAMSCAAPT